MLYECFSTHNTVWQNMINIRWTIIHSAFTSVTYGHGVVSVNTGVTLWHEPKSELISGRTNDCKNE